MRKVIVTGGNGQIGNAIINSLVNRADVLSIDTDNESVNKAVDYLKLDISDEEQVVNFFGKNHGKFDCLINNAGVGVFTPTENRTVEEFKYVMNINLLGTFLMINNFIKSGGRDVVNIGSIYGHISSDYRIYGNSGRNNSEVYTATKAGVIAMTKYFAVNYANKGVRCNSVSPGGVLREQSNDFLTEYKFRNPQNRLATDLEIANLVSYIALDSPSHLNGEDIKVDGGFTAW